VKKAFAINVNLAPSATIEPPTTATFFTGIPNKVVLSATGASTPLDGWYFRGDANAPWVSLQSSVFEQAKASLVGTPPVGTRGSFSVGIAPFAKYSATDPGLLYYTPFVIDVNNTPVFTNADSATFTVGVPSSFPIAVNFGNVSAPDPLPKGLSFNGANPASISGTPAAGTGGQYSVRLIDDAGVDGKATQFLSLDVYEKPQITSANSATFIAGAASSFVVSTTGYPNTSKFPLTDASVAPTSPAQGKGMHFTVSGLPFGLQASNISPQGYAGASLTIQGTVSASNAGVYPVLITAQNGVGTVQQTLMLTVVSITGPAPSSGRACNGNYNGSFRGSITVAAGQNCSFIGGTIDGSITVVGGSLSLLNTTVTGSVAIQGTSAFSLGRGTTINKNLSIKEVASGSTLGRVCQAQIGGNLEVVSNAIPISIGAPLNGCYGNTIGGNAEVSGNTAATSVYDNLVGKNLSCMSNSSLSGGNNAAQRKSGQCAAY
jgi:hypothetical protein